MKRALAGGLGYIPQVRVVLMPVQHLVGARQASHPEEVEREKERHVFHLYKYKWWEANVCCRSLIQNKS